MRPARTRKLFWEDPYCAQAACAVSHVRGAQVSLATTIFFAFSGGQESDRGTIGGFEVLDARKDGFDIVYRLPPAHTLAEGDVVPVAIDWTRRYRLMRLHFAAELTLEILSRRLPLEAVFHQGSGETRGRSASGQARPIQRRC